MKMKIVTTKIIIKVETNESYLTEENIKKYKENMYRILKIETDDNSVIEVDVGIDSL